MKPSRISLFLITSILLAGIFAGMILNLDLVTAKPEKTQQIDLYAITRHDETILDPYEDAFKELYPEVNDIKWLSPTAIAAWRSIIVSELVQVDFCWGGGPTFFTILADEGLLEPFENPDLIDYLDDNVPETIAGASMRRLDTNDNYLWVAAALSSFGFTINHDNLDEAGLDIPRTWEDLASPDYFLGTTSHAIGMGDAPSTTSNTRVYQIILQTFGWEAGWDIMNRMAGNAKIFEQGSGPTRDSVITGEQSIAMTIDFYGYQAMVQEEACEYILPEGQSIMNADPIAIAKGAQNKDYVEKFIQFVMSVEGQALWLEDTVNRLPMFYEAFDYAATQYDNPREDLESVYNSTIASDIIDFDEDLALAINDIVKFYFQGTFTKAQVDMYSAWGSIVTAYRNGEISEAELRSLSREMSNVTITLDEAKDLQQDYNADTTIKDDLITSFKSAAIARYNSIASRVGNESEDINDNGAFFDEFQVTITTPTEGQSLSGKVDVKADVVEYGDWSLVYGVTNVLFYADDNLIGNLTDAPYTVSWDTSGYADGPHTIRIVATEYTGRTTIEIIQVTVGSAKTLPDFSIDSPDNATTLENTTSIEITAQESNDYKIDYVTLEIFGSSGQAFFKSITSGFDRISEDWDISGARNGVYTVFATVFYKSGNSQYARITLSVGKELPTWKPAPGFGFTVTTLSLIALIAAFSHKRRRR